MDDKLDFVIRLLSYPLARSSLAVPGSEIPTSVGNGHSVLTNTEIEKGIFAGNSSTQDITGSHKGMEDKITCKVRDARSLLCNFGRETGCASKSAIGNYVQWRFSGRGAFKTDQQEWV